MAVGDGEALAISAVERGVVALIRVVRVGPVCAARHRGGVSVVALFRVVLAVGQDLLGDQQPELVSFGKSVSRQPRLGVFEVEERLLGREKRRQRGVSRRCHRRVYRGVHIRHWQAGQVGRQVGGVLGDARVGVVHSQVNDAQGARTERRACMLALAVGVADAVGLQSDRVPVQNRVRGRLQGLRGPVLLRPRPEGRSGLWRGLHIALLLCLGSAVGSIAARIAARSTLPPAPAWGLLRSAASFPARRSWSRSRRSCRRRRG